jgi:hypothetical protein
MSSDQIRVSSAGRPLSAGATALMLLLCVSWRFNQVAVKLALPDIPADAASHNPLLRRHPGLGYQVALSMPILGLAAWISAETIAKVPGPLALSLMVYQAVWVVGLAFLLWF